MTTKKVKITVVVAARPNFMKAAPLLHELAKYPDQFDYELVHTGQHYDYEMNQQFFEQLGIPKPDMDLEVGSGTHAQQTAAVMVSFEGYLLDVTPDLVIVFGDVNSTIACALAAKKLQIKVAHVEAGLRSWDETMPEEINRVMTDAISDRLYTPSIDGDQNLLNQGISKEKIKFVGNIMIDTLMMHIETIKKQQHYRQLGLEKGDYVLVTLHRPSNVDQKETLLEILTALTEIATQKTVVFSMHPRTRAKITAFGLDDMLNQAGINPNVVNGIGPKSYFEMIDLSMNAYAVITDSGGVQEETTVLGVPCLTLRDNTERPVTITEGSNQLVKQNQRAILEAFDGLSNGRRFADQKPRFWDGGTAKRIVADILDWFAL